MKNLEFLDPKFRQGENFTVRLGRKWLDVAIGEIVELVPVGLQIGRFHRAMGEITKLYHCRFVDCPEEVYKKEHDPTCRDFDGLLEAMKRAYPDDFSADKNGEDIENMIVTCVGFRVYQQL